MIKATRQKKNSEKPKFPTTQSNICGTGMRISLLCNVERFHNFACQGIITCFKDGCTGRPGLAVAEATMCWQIIRKLIFHKTFLLPDSVIYAPVYLPAHCGFCGCGAGFFSVSVLRGIMTLGTQNMTAYCIEKKRYACWCYFCCSACWGFHSSEFLFV